MPNATVHTLRPDPLPATQREVLMLAESGDLANVKGIAPQRKALARKGLLDGLDRITDLGRAQLEAEHAWQAPMHYADALAILGDSTALRRALAMDPLNQNGYGTHHYIGTWSSDGRTCYLSRRHADTGKNPHDVVAIIANTIPSWHLPFFGPDPLDRSNHQK